MGLKQLKPAQKKKNLKESIEDVKNHLEQAKVDGNKKAIKMYQDILAKLETWKGRGKK